MMGKPDNEVVPVIQAERFWSRVDKRGPDDCWPWLGGHGSGTDDGCYGRFYVARGKTRVAHQVAWEIANNSPFPAGLKGCHSCDNPNCVNPKHVWPGTQSDNIKDCVSKGRHASKPREFCQRGHPMTPQNRRPTTGGYRCGECTKISNRECVRRLRAKRKAVSNG